MQRRPRKLFNSISESDNAAESESNDDEANAGTGDRTDRGTTSDTTITVDQWVVVGYPGKRKNTQLMYVGQVTQVHGDNDNVDVTFVKKLSGTTDPIFTYPTNEETDTVPVSYIVQHVSQPHTNNRHHLVFSDIKHTIVR